MIGTPLVEFICTTLIVCLAMTLTVLMCCFYIKFSAHRDLSNQENTSTNGGWTGREFLISMSSAEQMCQRNCLQNPKQNVQLPSAHSLHDHVPKPAENRMYNYSQNKEFCTIFVPDVGIVL